MEGKINIKNYNQTEMETAMAALGLPKYRAKQVFEWVYKDAADFAEMSNLPKKLQEDLAERFSIGRAQVIRKQLSKTDGTRKYLLGFDDGKGGLDAVECVLMEYSHGKTICISTQVGCRMSCSFCASAVGGLVRNLTAGEMIEEVLAVSRDMGERISNIVLMGAGEPFDNYEEVIRFLKLVNDEKGLNVGLRHITLSTSGLVPMILKFADEKLPCTLAVSLHAADDFTREQLMPVNRKYNIKQLLEACRYYIEKSNKRVTFEYALIKDVNDQPEDAENLGKLLRGMLCHVNLIPVNPVEGKDMLKSKKERIKAFQEILAKYRIEATVRRELGSDIDAACGQLRQKHIESCSQ